MHEYQMLAIIGFVGGWLWLYMCKFLSFCPLSDLFTPLADEENKIFIKNKKNKNKNMEIILFYKCVPNVMIIGCVGGWYG